MAVSYVLVRVLPRWGRNPMSYSQVKGIMEPHLLPELPPISCVSNPVLERKPVRLDERQGTADTPGIQPYTVNLILYSP